MYKVLLTLFFVVSTVFCQEACEGAKIIYPKSGSVFTKTKEESSLYMIMGNSLEKSYLKQVTLIKNETQESNTVWTGHDELLKVSVVQQDLNKTQLSLPNTFLFRALVEEDGRECQVESGWFEIN
ncbi:hypothetical protein G6F56_012619 [Rhizopus delemar]|nr:hypothetical protein G6F56_012619 [Rhizopus delemar]